ncbi:MAG: serine hydrolase [Defluviitaleaceae bacterium]|nr:serine hydrolase [Defluviitaleaceae bacterium]
MKKFVKRLTAAALSAVMVVSSGILAFGSVADTPLRQTLEDAGAVVEWVDGQIFVSIGYRQWVFTPGAGIASLNGIDVVLAAPVIIEDGTSFFYGGELSWILGEGEEVVSEQFAETVALATMLGQQSTAEGGIVGMTIAVVDAETGFTWTQGFGYADSVRGLPVDEHTLFQIGSTSKPFTAIAVMQLVEEGLVDLDNPVVYYVPEFSMLPSFIHGGNSDNITVRMLLNNTSGIMPDYLRAFYMAGNESYQGGMNDILERLHVREMSFVEGTAYEYANLGWVVLGILVAQVTGNDNYFEGFVQFTDENILAPVGMTRSSFAINPQVTNVSMGYTEVGNQDEFIHVGLASAGSMFSSAHDMALFMHDFLGGDSQILTQESIAYMTQSHTDHVDMTTAPFEAYGLGFIRGAMLIGNVAVGHGGGTVHWFTDMLMCQETQIGVFVSTNTSAGMFTATPVTAAILETAIIEKTGMDISHIIAQLEADAASAPAMYDPTATSDPMSDEEMTEFIAEFGGLYDFGPLGFWYLGLTDGELTFSAGDVVEGIGRMSDGTFEVTFGDVIPGTRYSFVMMEGQAVSTFMLSALGAVLPAMRVDDMEAWEAQIAEQVAPEDFAQFIGVYHFMPQIEGEMNLNANTFIVALDEFGRATIAQVTPFMPPVGQLLTHYEGRWFLMQSPIFFTYEDGVAGFDLMGGQFVREQ